MDKMTLFRVGHAFVNPASVTHILDSPNDALVVLYFVGGGKFGVSREDWQAASASADWPFTFKA